VVARDQPARYESVLDLATVEAAIFEGNPRREHLQVVRDGPVDAKQYVYPSGLVDPLAVSRLFEDGCSVVLPQAQERLVGLWRLTRGLEAELGCRVQANVYLSPDGASAFVAHYDLHDVLVLQVHGAKDWELYEGGLSGAARPFDPELDAPGPVTERFTLLAGDLAYVPRGCMHRAAADAMSLHVTIGIHWVTLIDVVRAVLTVAGEGSVELGGALPPGWWEAGEAGLEAIRRVQDVVPGLVEDVQVASVLDGMRRDLVATRQPFIPGQLHQLGQLDGLDSSRVVAPRDPMLWDLSERTDEVVLSCFGADVVFPAKVAPSLRQLLAHGPAGVPISAIEGSLDDEERLVLVRRLVREGVLQVLD